MSTQEETTYKSEETVEQEPEQAESDAVPAEKSGVRGNWNAPPPRQEFEEGDKVSVRVIEHRVSKKVKAKVIDARLDSRRRWEYKLGHPAPNEWFKETELSWA